MASFRLILKGSTQDTPAGLVSVKKKLKNYLGSDDKTLDELFESLPAILEEGLDQQTATSLQDAFRNLGAEVTVENESGQIPDNLPGFEFETDDLSISENKETTIPDKQHVSPATDIKTSIESFTFDFEEPASNGATSTTSEPSPTADLSLKFDEESNILPTPATDNKEPVQSSEAPDLNINVSVADLPGFVHTEEITSSAASPEPKISPFVEKDTNTLPPTVIQNLESPTAPKYHIALPRFTPKLVASGAATIAIVIAAVLFISRPQSDEAPGPQISDPTMLLKLLDQQQAIIENQNNDIKSNSSQASSIAVIPDTTWLTTITSEGLNATLELLSGEDQIIEVNLKTQLPTKKQLTPEEIVDGLKAAPFIEKFFLENPRLTETALKGIPLNSFNITLPGRAYIKDGINAARITAGFTIIGKLDTESPRISGTWILKTSGQPSATSETPPGISRVDNNIYRIFLTGTFSLTKVQKAN